MTKKKAKDKVKETKKTVKAKEIKRVKIRSKGVFHVVLEHDIFCKAMGKCYCRRMKRISVSAKEANVAGKVGKEEHHELGKAIMVPMAITILPGVNEVYEPVLKLPVVQKAIKEHKITVM